MLEFQVAGPALRSRGARCGTNCMPQEHSQGATKHTGIGTRKPMVALFEKVAKSVKDWRWSGWEHGWRITRAQPGCTSRAGRIAHWEAP